MKSPNRKFYGLSLGAIVPALGFSLTWFCCLPLAAGALGAGMAALGSVLSPLRPYFTVAAVVLLGAAFYHTYKPRKVECTPGESCAIQANRTRQQAVLWAVAVITLALLTIGEWSSWVIYWML
ncbi:MAG: mercuric transporter MerT family protein [Blastocatellia bacterium]